jgi:hypothetical protein
LKEKAFLLESIMSSHIGDGNAVPPMHKQGLTDCRGREPHCSVSLRPGVVLRRDFADVDQDDLIASDADQMPT